MDNPSYVIYCESFYSASRFAAERGWGLSEWIWLPNRTIRSDVVVFQRTEGS